MKKTVYVIIIFLISISLASAQTEKKEEAKEAVKKEMKKETTKAPKTKEQYMANLSSDKDEKLIIEAAEWAGKEEEKDAIPALIKLVDDKRENVRMYAVMALGYIGEESSIDAVHKVLLDDSSAEVRYAAMLATLRIGSEKSIDTWKKVKEKENDPFILDILKKMEEKATGK